MAIKETQGAVPVWEELDIADLTDDEQDMLARARDVRENAISPYHNYKVGAVVETGDGRQFEGANFETNIHVGVHAEVAALCAAIAAGALQAHGVKRIVTVGGIDYEEGTPEASINQPPTVACDICRGHIRALLENHKDIIFVAASVTGQIVRATGLSNIAAINFDHSHTSPVLPPE